MHIVLYEPEIPPNTGNLIRLCANTGVQLHLIEPLGFSLESKALRRAGLDYHECARVQTHSGLENCLSALQHPGHQASIYAVTTKGDQLYHNQSYHRHDVLLFGPESRGLPDQVLHDPRIRERIRLPMMPGSRSLNLANAVSIVVFEALRQLDFPDLN